MTKDPMTNCITPRRLGERASVALTMCACVALGLCAGCQKPAATTPAAAQASGSSSGLSRVTAGHLTRKTLTLNTLQPARIEAFEETPLYPKITGYVEQITVDIGDRVTKDQVLVRLWVPELVDDQTQKRALVAQAEADVKQAQAAVAAAQAGVKTAQAQLAGTQAGVMRAAGEFERWKAESNRISQLVASGVVTQKLADETLNQLRAAEGAQAEAAAAIASVEATVELAEANVRKAEADQIAAEARIAVAQADLARATTMLGYTTIAAPFDGVITERNVDTRHFVGSGSGLNKPLLVIAQMDTVRIFADIPETEAGLVSIGKTADPVTITVQALGNKSFDGPVTRTSWSLDPATRSLKTEIDVPNPDGLLRPGMYATIQLRLDEVANALVVPAAAIVRDGGTFCCVVEGGAIVRRPVELGLRSGDEIEVKSGLAETDLVVLKGAGSLKAGQQVEVIAPPAPK
jgi:HlyD family secretion protein